MGAEGVDAHPQLAAALGDDGAAAPVGAVGAPGDGPGASEAGEEADLCVMVDSGGVWLARLGLADPEPRRARLHDDLVTILQADPDIAYLGTSEAFPI